MRIKDQNAGGIGFYMVSEFFSGGFNVGVSLYIRNNKIVPYWYVNLFFANCVHQGQIQFQPAKFNS